MSYSFIRNRVYAERRALGYPAEIDNYREPIQASQMKTEGVTTVCRMQIRTVISVRSSMSRRSR